MKEIVLFDKEFNAAKTDKYHLSIQLDSESYSYAVLDVKNRKYIGLKHVAFETPVNDENLSEKLSSIVDSDSLLSQNFNQIYFSLPNKRFTLVPEKYFSDNVANEFLRFNQFVGENEFVKWNKINGLDAMVVYPFSINFHETLIKYFPSVKSVHQASPVINDLLKYKEKVSDTTTNLVSININSHFVDIAVANGEKLLFYNTFSYSNSAEFIFYVLSSLKELNLDLAKVGVIVSGNVDEISPLYIKLEKYIKYLKFHKLSDVLFYSYSFKEVNQHQFVNLFNLYKCA